MTKTSGPDMPPAGLRPMRDLRAGFALLTRLPLPPPASFPVPPAVWAWPLVGLVCGTIAAGVGVAAMALALPAWLAATLALASMTLITGALHEDGLADCCDGFWGGWDRTRRLEIMKDSHIGSYGVMGLVLVTLARIAAIAALAEAGAWGAMIAAACLSRPAMAGLMAGLPNARGTGLAQAAGRPAAAAVLGSIALALVLSLALTGAAGLAMAAAASLASLALALLARHKIGGQTGDVLGACQQLSELAALIMAVIVLT